MNPPTPPDNRRRLEALRRYGILDTPAEEDFDGITRLAAFVCRAPIAVINFVDEARQWFKSENGLGLRETPLDVSICAHAILQPGLYVVPDTALDERFAANPLVVGEPHLRFYAGALLETADGYALGTLCVLDRVPRDLDEPQRDALRTLARQVMAQLELRRELLAQARSREELERANRVLAESEERHRCITELTSDYAVSGRVEPDGQVVLEEATGGFAKVTGYTLEELEARGGWAALIHPDDRPLVAEALVHMLEGEAAGSEVRIITRSGEARWLHYLGRGVRDPDSGQVVRLHAAAQDVTERKQAADALRESEAWLATTLASIGDAVIAADDQGRVRLMNPVAEALTGWDLAEAAGRPLGEIYRAIGETSGRPAVDPFKRALREEVLVGPADRTVLVSRQGGRTPIEDRASPIRGRGGVLAGVVLVFRDVTQERASRRRILESEERYRTLIEVSPQVVWYGRGDGYITYCNRWWHDYTGLTTEQSEGNGWIQAIHPAHRDRVREVWLEAAARGDKYALEVPFLRASDGTYRWHLSTGRPILDESGRVARWVGVALDIDDRKRAEDARRESEDRLRFTLEATGVGDWDLDLATGRLDRSPRYDRIFGHEALVPSWEYQTFLGHLHPDDRDEVNTSFREATASGREWECECRIVRPDLAVRWIWLKSGAYVIGPAGPERVLGLVMDITDRKVMEGELRGAKEDAEAASLAKTQFLAVLSHELRTPLNPILLAASSMLERPGEPEDLRPTLEMIRQNVQLQARLIDDLLDVMRIVRGKLPLHWEVVDAHRLIDRAVRICRAEVEAHQLRLEVDLAASLRHVNADPARLQQVFWNLIKNAVKFTPEGGSIVIRTCDEPGTGPGGGRFAVEVADTGLGIAPDVLTTIFDPFQQGETTITRRFGGLGLGLAICKGIVDAHGGSLEVESPGPGHGATFRVVLKALPDPREPVVEAGASGDLGSVAPALPSSLRILLVEDEPTTLRLMARLLRGLGHEVTTAGDLAAATASLDAAFDLVVSDIGLPDGSGLDVIRRVVARKGPVPAIALTGYGMEEDIRRSREAGFTAHLTKPIDFAKLQAMIRRVAPTLP